MSQTAESGPSSVVYISSARSRTLDRFQKDVLDDLARDKGKIAENTWGKYDELPEGAFNNTGSWSELLSGVSLKDFKPCVVYYEGIQATEMLLEDCSIVWCPWGPLGHAVDLGYSDDGRLVGIRIWDAVYERKLHSEAHQTSATER